MASGPWRDVGSGPARPTADTTFRSPPTILEQQFPAALPNQVWLADITYLPTAEGWLYLAAVLDPATRKIVG